MTGLRKQHKDATASLSPAELRRLCSVLNLPSEPAAFNLPVGLDHLIAWKPIVEKLAYDHPAGAEEAADLILRAGQASGDSGCLALARWISGNVQFILDRPTEALRHFEQAERLYGARNELLQIARLSVGKVSALDKLGRYQAALLCGQAAVPLLAASPDEVDQRRLTGIYNGIGISSEHLGRYAEALDAYERKWEWWRDQPGTRAQIETARALVNIGVVKTRLGLYVEAGNALLQARRTLEQVPTDGQVLADIARIDINTAWLETLRGSPPEAVAQAFVHARESRLALDPDATSTDLIVLDLFEAEWRMRQGYTRPNEEVSLLALQERCATAGLAFETARAELLLAYLSLNRDDAAKAQQEFSSIADTASERQDAEIMFLAGLGYARALRQVGQTSNAQNVLEGTLDHVEGLRQRLQIDEFRAGYLEDKTAAYHELADLFIEMQDYRNALQVVERSKARTLAELLRVQPDGAAGAEEPQGATDRLSSELQQIRGALQQPNLAITPKIRQEQESRAVFLMRQLSRHRFRYLAETAGYMETVDEIAARLPVGTLALAYAVIYDRVWVFIADQAGLHGSPVCLGHVPDLDDLRLDLGRIGGIGRLSNVVAERWLPQQEQAAQIPLARWYTQYLAPLQPVLQGYDRLLIVPDGLLNLLPFTALFDAERGQYLIQRHEVVLAPSLAVWALLVDVGSSQGQNAGLKAAQGENGHSRLDYPARMPTISNESNGKPLVVGCSCGGRLPHAVSEAKQVAAAFPRATLLVEADATRERFAQHAGAAGFVYLAAHSVFRPDAPAFSFLELADGRLEAFDISQMELSASAVVLSACETGVGHLTGNELMGMVRTFLHAGARSVIATCWPVEDEAMASLMTEFVRRARCGERVAQAVRGAQQALINGTLEGSGRATWSHPYYWGALTLVGADGTL